MSPVWIKLGDFGVSKRILAQAITTFHTQVSTPVYSAPEVMGLDSNSETSNYTNSVDIWSLGCVIYELLTGAKLFVSEGQVSRYYFDKWPFPENKLKGLSPPIDDVGISLLKSMLVIQPEDRPTVASALSHGWLADLKNGNEDSRGDLDEAAQSRDRNTVNRKRENKLAIHNGRKRSRSENNPITQDNTRCIPEGAALGVGAAFSGSSAVQARPRRSEPISYNFQATHSKGLETQEEKRVGDILLTYLQGRTPNAKLNINTKRAAN